MNVLLLKSILRGYFRNATFSLLNFVSIILVMIVSYLGLGYLKYEYSYESNHEKSSSIYRVGFNYRSQVYSIVAFPGYSSTDKNAQLAYVNAMRESSAIKSVCQFITQPATEYLQTNEKQIPQDGLLFTNTPADFVAMFTWKPALGSMANFAQGADRILITESVARNLFDDNYRAHPEIIGSEVRIAGRPYVLAAVIEDVPGNSHFDFSVALSTDILNYWGSRLYVEKNSIISDDRLQSEMNSAISAVNPKLAADELYLGLSIQKISTIHMGTPALYELKNPGNRQYILLIAIFTIFILVLGAFNYSNISMAIYTKNEKSFGIKRVVGASSGDVTLQLWLNGLLLAFLSVIPALAILTLAVPFFNELMHVQLAFNPFQDFTLIGTTLGLALLIGSIASLGPILMVSKKPVLGFFRNIRFNHSKLQMPLRNQLVVSQFIVLIIISSLCYVVLRQLDFISNKDVGYNSKNILYAYTSDANRVAFQQALKSTPGIQYVGNGSAFGTESFNTLTYRLDGTEEIFNDSRQLYIDTEALKAYGLTTTLSNIPPTAFTLINRTAAERLAKVKGISADELTGSVIITEPEYVNPETGQAGIPFTIAGIFEDIHLFSLHEKVEPYFLTVSPTLSMDGRTIIAVEGEVTSTLIEKIQTEYNKLNEEFPLQVDALQANVDELYQQDRQFGTLLFYLNIIALAISSIGFISITIFTLRTKVKEIGIRKVLGAGLSDLIKLMSKGYLPLIALALVIAWPAAYYLAQLWLQEFAYRISLSQWIFPAIGLFTLLFTLSLIFGITSKVAQANPVDSIRNE